MKIYRAAFDWINPQTIRSFIVRETNHIKGQPIPSAWSATREGAIERGVKYLSGFRDNHSQLVARFDSIILQLNEGHDEGRYNQ